MFYKLANPVFWPHSLFGFLFPILSDDFAHKYPTSTQADNYEQIY